MTIQLIFGPDANENFKDIIFFTAYPGMVLPVVYFSVDSSLMPPRSYLFSVCH